MTLLFRSISEKTARSLDRRVLIDSCRSKIPTPHMGVSENRGPQYSTLNSRIRIIKDPK